MEVDEAPELSLESQPLLGWPQSVPWPKGPVQVISAGLYLHPRKTWRDLIHAAAHSVRFASFCLMVMVKVP